MGQFILSSAGSLGDVYPYIGLGKALRDRGHHVTLLSFDRFEQQSRAAGLDFVAIAAWSQLADKLAGNEVYGLPAFTEFVAWAVRTFMRPVYDAIAAHAVPGQTTLVAHPGAVGARIASEKLGLRLATIHLAPQELRSAYMPPRVGDTEVPRWLWRSLSGLIYRLADADFDRICVAEINRFRIELGLPTIKRTLRWVESEELVLGLFPQWYAPRQPDWSDKQQLSDFPLYDGSNTERLAPALAAFLRAGPPPIAFALGSLGLLYKDTEWFYTAAQQACRTLGRRGILVGGPHDQRTQRLPGDIMRVGYTRYSELLPRVAAFVHPGGVGAAALALRAGIAQLVVPCVADQFDNARRLRWLGVARELSRSKFRSPALAETLRDLLEDSSVRTATRRNAARFDVDPFDSACTQLETFAGLAREDSPRYAQAARP